jgi:hypothetical protein
MYNAQYNKTLNVMYICLLLSSNILQGAFKFQSSAHRCGRLIMALKGATSVILENYLMPQLLALQPSIQKSMSFSTKCFLANGLVLWSLLHGLQNFPHPTL